jgi:hypothetical protein
MKRITFIAIALSLLMVGCYNKKRLVDETVETDRYTLQIQGIDAWRAATGRSNVNSCYSESGDTTVLTTTVPWMASFLVSHYPIATTTMYYVNKNKQNFLPNYFFTLVDHDTAQPADYPQLLQAMIDRGILRTDTTYEPLQQLVVFDSARLEAHRKMEVQEGDTDVKNIAAIIVQLRANRHMPVSAASNVDMDIIVDGYDIGKKDWQADSLWLDERGMRVVPDPEGRQMRIIEFNRAKGRI